MKNILFILLFISSLSYGQNIRIGARASGEIYWLGIAKQTYADGEYTSGPLFEAYSIGLTSEIGLSKNISLKPEALFNKSHGSGFYTDHTRGDTAFLNTAQIKQVQIPVFLKIRANNRGLYILFGPSNSIISKEINNNKRLYF